MASGHGVHDQLGVAAVLEGGAGVARRTGRSRLPQPLQEPCHDAMVRFRRDAAWSPCEHPRHQLMTLALLRSSARLGRRA